MFMRIPYAALVLCAMTMAVMPVKSQTLTTLHRFCALGNAGVCPDGAAPVAALVQTTDGEFFGTTTSGGTAAFNGAPANGGTVFKISSAGMLTTVHSFCDDMNAAGECLDGKGPSSGLIQATNGILYGLTGEGGTHSFENYEGNSGTVYSITLSGVETVLYNFCSVIITNTINSAFKTCLDGEIPDGGLIEATNGFLYGSTLYGGSFNPGTLQGGGTAFRISPTNTLHASVETLHSFCQVGTCSDGGPALSPLIQAADGELYGTGTFGGTGFDLNGTVFRMTPRGVVTVLYSFMDPPRGECSLGERPNGLLQATDGNFYGSTLYCGTGASSTDGTIFRVTPDGRETTLYDFCQITIQCFVDGSEPSALIQASDGNFYGTTQYYGNVGNSQIYGQGTIFRITPKGDLTTLYAFCSTPPCVDGANPQGALLQGTDGAFYGTTSDGGSAAGIPAGGGTVFRFSVGLAPFVRLLTPSGSVGAAVRILGSALKDSKSVTFNGIPAAFSVVSDSEIMATVPMEATSGPVKVKTAAGTLSGNVPFTVVQFN